MGRNMGIEAGTSSAIAELASKRMARKNLNLITKTFSRETKKSIKIWKGTARRSQAKTFLDKAAFTEEAAPLFFPMSRLVWQ